MVTLYSKTDCNPCKLLKKKFEREGIEFVERNVQLDADAKAEVEALGYMGVPVVVAPDGTHFQGIQPDKLAALRSE